MTRIYSLDLDATVAADYLADATANNRTATCEAVEGCMVSLDSARAFVRRAARMLGCKVADIVATRAMIDGAAYVLAIHNHRDCAAMKVAA